MNASSRSVFLPRHPARGSATSSRVKPSQPRQLSTPTPISSRMGRQNVERLKTSNDLMPGWLRSLIVLQRCSDLTTFLLFAAILTVYSWTVFTQQQWTKEYRKLETLQRNERHLTTTKAGLDNALAEQAERPETGLVSPSTKNNIVLRPAPQRPSQPAPQSTQDSESIVKTPLGY